MHITIDDIEYKFKNEPSTRDLIKIGLYPTLSDAMTAYLKALLLERKAYDDLWKDKDEKLWPVFETTLTEPATKSSDYRSVLEYNGRLLNTLYLGTEIPKWEDWLDAPRHILKEACAHPKILKIMGELYG